MTDEEFKRRSREDFDFLVLCQLKQNMGMYHLLKDTAVDAERERRKKQAIQDAAPDMLAGG